MKLRAETEGTVHLFTVVMDALFATKSKLQGSKILGVNTIKNNALAAWVYAPTGNIAC